MRRLLLVGCIAWAICFVSPAIRTWADDEKPAADQAQKDQPKDQEKDKAKDKPAADKATLVDKLLGVIENEKPADSQKPADASKPNAADSEKPKTDKPQETKKEAKKEVKKANLVRFTLSGEYPDEKGGAGLMAELGSLGEEAANLYEMIDRLDAAAKDKDVVAVWLRFDEFQPTGGNIYEFRAAINRLQKAGKKVFAELLNGGDSSVYLVASACDKIYLPEGTGIEIIGPHMARQHFKGLLDKLGMQFDVLRMGRCKGAYEPFTHEKMSDEVRENYQSLVDDRYEQLVETIAADRKLEAAKVKELIDRGIFTPDTALKAGLVDYVVYASRMEDELKTAMKGEENLKIVSNYKKKKKEEITSVFDLMKLFAGEKSKKSTGKKKIAIVYETGEITTGKSSSGGLLSGKSQGSTTIAKLLRKVADDADVKAVVVRIDGPGGSATASDLIWQETIRLKEKKPVISSMSSVAASGTYYTAVAGTKIFAEQGTITGSIGVIGGKMVTETLMKKLGVNTEYIGRGKLSGVELDRPFTPYERKVLIEMVEDTYREFKSKVAKCRGMTFDKVSELAEGRVYTARQALKIGLIDEIGTMTDAIAAAKQAAGLKADEEVEIVQYPEEKSIFEILSGNQDEDETLTAAFAAQFAGIPPKTLKNLQLPSFFFHPETSAKPHLYFWSAVPTIK